MKRIIIIFLVIPLFAIANQDSLLNVDKVCFDSITDLSEEVVVKKDKISLLKQENIIAWRLQMLDENSPMDLVYNDKVVLLLPRNYSRMF